MVKSKKLKREYFPNISDKDFESLQHLKDMKGEGFSVE